LLATYFASAGAVLTPGTTPISGGTDTKVLYNNAGILGEYSISGTGSVAMTNSPTFVTPALGTPSAAVLTNATGLPVAALVGDTTTALGVGSINLGHASDTTLARVSAGVISVEGVTILTTATGQPLDADLTSWAAVTRASGFDAFAATPSSANLISLVTDETGSGALVFATSPTLVTPALGTPSSGTLTNCTGLPVVGGISGFATGMATFLSSPTSANLAATVADETGSGALVFGTSPTLTTPNIGTPSAGTLTNCLGYAIPFLGNGGSESVAAGQTKYLGARLDSVQSNAYFTVPQNGILDRLFVYCSGAPGTGETFTCTLQAATGAPTDTTVTCTISGNASNSASDTTNTKSVLAGDRWVIKVVGSAGAASQAQWTWAVRFRSTA